MAKQFLLSEEIKKEWDPVITAEGAPELKDVYAKNGMYRLLENTKEELLGEASVAAGIAKYDPVLISMLRRVAPSLVQQEFFGVHQMSGPSGLIFVMKSWYNGDQGVTGPEAFTNQEPNKNFSGPMSTAAGEALGVAKEVDATIAGQAPVTQVNPWAEMSFSIEKVTVTPETRALKAEFTDEMAQDMKDLHGEDAQSLLANMLSMEVVAERNREAVFNLNTMAKPGAQNTVLAGTFDINADSDGRWSVEKYKSLMVQIAHESVDIALDARRGLGNFVVCSANIAAVLDEAGSIDSTFNPGITLNAGSGVTFAGILSRKYKLYIDEYAATDYITVGYNGSIPNDSGYFIVDHTPIRFMRAVNSDSLQPVVAVKTRYGQVANPLTSGAPGSNAYYRRFLVTGV